MLPVRKSLSSSCWAISPDIPNPFSPPLPIVHRFRLVTRVTPCIVTELLCVYSNWLFCFAQPCEGVHRSISLKSSSLLLQEYLARLTWIRLTWIRLSWIVFLMGGKWPYCWCFVWCYLPDLFNIYIRKWIYEFSQLELIKKLRNNTLISIHDILGI